MHILLSRFPSAVRLLQATILCLTLLSFLLFSSFSGGAAEAERPGNDSLDILLAMNLEDLIQVEVITASKHPQKIRQAPSPVYVFTAEDIQRTAARNFMELVTFIPGFYVYPRIDQTFRIVTRGINSFDKILFLIDGIPMNNIAQGGAVNMHLFPALDKIKRVEVVAGPGSTMWGSDAALR
jgi:iron complex outermembrane receptor protein